MKTLKKGHKQKSWSKKYKCTGRGHDGGGCNTILLIEEKDLFVTSVQVSYDDLDYFVTFKCSACGTFNNIGGYPYIANLPTYESWQRKQRTAKHNPIMMVMVDVVMRCGNQVLLVRRVKSPFEGSLVFPGEHLEKSDLSLKHAGARGLKEELSITVKPEDLRLLTVLDGKGRDPRYKHTMSVVFVVDVPRFPKYQVKPDEVSGVVITSTHDLLPVDFGFDHAKVLELLRKDQQHESAKKR